MSSSKFDVFQEFDNLYTDLQEKKMAIEEASNKLESERKERYEKKKDILMKEMKKALAVMNDTDVQVVHDLQQDTFDMITTVSEIIEEVDALKESGSIGDIKSLMDKVNGLGLLEFVENLDVSMTIQPSVISSAFEKIADAFVLNSPILKPKMFFLEIPERLPSYQANKFNPSSFEIQIHRGSESITFNPIVLENLMINITCQVPGQDKVVLDVGSVWTRMEKMKARISDDEGHITVQLKRPNNIVGRLSVMVLGSNIVNSPIVHQFCLDEEKDPSSHNLTLANDSIGVFDMTVSGLDKSGCSNLEKTRRRLLLGAGKPTIDFPLPEEEEDRNLSGQSQDVDPVPDTDTDPDPDPASSIWDDVSDCDEDEDNTPVEGACWPSVLPIWNSSIAGSAGQDHQSQTGSEEQANQRAMGGDGGGSVGYC